jgi:hypothetical protein
MLEIQRGSTRLHSVGSSLWKRLRTSRKTEYGMHEQSNCTRRAGLTFRYILYRSVLISLFQQRPEVFTTSHLTVFVLLLCILRRLLTLFALTLNRSGPCTFPHFYEESFAIPQSSDIHKSRAIYYSSPSPNAVSSSAISTIRGFI